VDAAMIEKRVARRYRVLKRGKLAFGGGGGTDGTVRDISNSGARIDLDGPASLPASFMLVIEADHFMRRCRPIWNRNSQIGVAFS
jgi:hypothetical protein